MISRHRRIRLQQRLETVRQYRHEVQLVGELEAIHDAFAHGVIRIQHRDMVRDIEVVARIRPPGAMQPACV